MPGYLIWLNARLYEMKRLLKKSGTIYLHLDWHAVSYVKAEMDKIFGIDCFRNEVIWYYYNKLHGAKKRVFPRATETIFYYLKNPESNFRFQFLTEERDQPVKKLKYSFVGGKIVNDKDENGKTILNMSLVLS